MKMVVRLFTITQTPFCTKQLVDTTRIFRMLLLEQEVGSYGIMVLNHHHHQVRQLASMLRFHTREWLWRQPDNVDQSVKWRKQFGCNIGDDASDSSAFWRRPSCSSACCSRGVESSSSGGGFIFDIALVIIIIVDHHHVLIRHKTTIVVVRSVKSPHLGIHRSSILFLPLCTILLWSDGMNSTAFIPHGWSLFLLFAEWVQQLNVCGNVGSWRLFILAVSFQD